LNTFVQYFVKMQRIFKNSRIILLTLGVVCVFVAQIFISNNSNIKYANIYHQHYLLIKNTTKLYDVQKISGYNLLFFEEAENNEIHYITYTPINFSFDINFIVENSNRSSCQNVNNIQDIPLYLLYQQFKIDII
jgi:hypothetical protein